MIFNNSKIYAKVWDITPSENGKYIDLRVTTSEKVEDDKYENSSWFPRCIGKSVNTLKNLKVGDSIVITKSKFTNISVKKEDGTHRSYFRFLILDAEIQTNENAKDTETNKKVETKTIASENEEDSPW